METSYNGWPASRTLKTRVIEPVKGVRLPVADNANVATVFTYLVKEYHKRVDDVTKPHAADDWGFAYRPNVNDPSELSNHSSGTAIDLDATEHPNGVPTRDTLTDAQIAEVHKILAELGDVVRWGGDYTHTVDAMHFEINVKPGSWKLRRVARRLRRLMTAPTISVISWNVYVKHPVEDVVKELKSMIASEHPDAIFLYEAKHLYGHLEGLGYDVAQYKPQSLTPDSQSNNGNIAVLVKAGLPKSTVFALKMNTFWTGPKTGLRQDPRVYRWVRVKKLGVTWKLGGFHLPFGLKARKESVSAMVNWFRLTWPKRAIIAFADYQKPADVAEEELASKVGAKVAGEGIDLEIYKNCRLVSKENLGHRGSDHPAMKYILQKI